MMSRFVNRYLPGIITLVLAILLLVAFFYKWSWININPGERGVLWSRLGDGTVTDKSYREGVNIIWPWNRMYVYDVRAQQIQHEMDALTGEGLKIHFSISIRYHPEIELLGLLHQKLGPDYANRVVVPEVESVIRSLISKTNIDEIYGSQNDRLQNILTGAVSAIEREYVVVDEVAIRQVALPKSVEIAIEEKMAQKQSAEAYKYKLDREAKEAERKKIEADGQKQFNDILSSSLNDKLLTWRWIEAAQSLATSNNAKTIVIGNQTGNLPIILGGHGLGQ